MNILFPCILLYLLSASIDSGVASSIVVRPLKARRTGVSSRQRRQATEETPDITNLHVTSSVRSRFAEVLIASKIVNTKDKSLEATFSVQIPETAFISNFSMVINDTLMIGKVYEKKEAQKKYDEAKEQGQSAGQVRHQAKAARGMEIFNINVNVAAMDDVEFELSYQQLLERRLGLYEQRIVVQPLQVVENLTLDLTFDEPQQFDRFTFTEPNRTDLYSASSDSTVLMSSPTTKTLTYRPSVSVQRAVDQERGIDGEFVVTYDVGHKFDGGNIISAEENDNFIHYFAVEESNELPPISKNIMFVIDISGSMSGRKIEQTRDAMKEILPQLRSYDYFNILLFDDQQYYWPGGRVLATPGNIEAAQAYVEAKVHANGGTNINDALIKSIGTVADDDKLQNRAGILIFLTDGQPTSGVSDIPTILDNIHRVNEGRVGLFALGFGNNVNFEFLEMISWDNGGFAKRIYEESDAADQLVNFFREVNNPLLREVRFEYLPEQVILEELTQTRFLQFFGGSEVVVAGKLIGSTIDATVRGSTSSNVIELVVPDSSKSEISGPSGAFTEKLTAYLTIKDLLRKKAIARTDSQKQILESQALNLSLEHNLVTPLTSLLVVQEDFDRNSYQEDAMVRKSGNTFNHGIQASGFPAGSSNMVQCVTWLVMITQLLCYTYSQSWYSFS